MGEESSLRNNSIFNQRREKAGQRLSCLFCLRRFLPETHRIETCRRIEDYNQISPVGSMFRKWQRINCFLITKLGENGMKKGPSLIGWVLSVEGV
jgi:hypothetical protein